MMKKHAKLMKVNFHPDLSNFSCQNNEFLSVNKSIFFCPTEKRSSSLQSIQIINFFLPPLLTHFHNIYTKKINILA